MSATQSNASHCFALVVQVHDGEVWMDSRYGGDTIGDAKRAEKELLANNAVWMPGSAEPNNRRTRIVARRLT